MSIHTNDGRSGQSRGTISYFTPCRRFIAGIAALLMCASFFYTPGTSAHDLDTAKARETARDYARAIRAQSNGKYLHYSTRCGRAFPHIVKCTIEYQNAKDTAAGVYTCKETIELYYQAHSGSGSQNYTVGTRHTSGNLCGPRLPNVAYP